MHILAADIGGTHARFAAATVDTSYKLDLGPLFSFETRQPGVHSFGEFWDTFRRLAPSELAETRSFDAIALALAGSVDGDSAVLPNIDWDISANETRTVPRLYLLNDFVAQGHALTVPGALTNLEVIRAGEETETGNIALIGAGTGLGHCAVLTQPGQDSGAHRYWVAGSEAGHATFAFQGDQERAIEQRWLERSGKRWLSNDDVVSGPGAARLYACLNGEVVTPAQALADEHSVTAEVFSRFYARACRNHCLSVFPVRCLVLSGGLAARNPYLVRSAAFQESFDDGEHYRPQLARIPIRLNTDDCLGIRGAAIYAARLTKARQAS